ncbi:MAG: copper homeostasis protein CutC [Bacteroidota bacterium]|nr:copper homeostasis protein CutC [Bacteroidota bacterium]
MNYNLEICAFNIKDCIDISKFDISRIELCTNKKKGGLTPSKNSIIKSLKLNIPIHPIIRPRGGNFLYNKTELRQMIESIKFCKNIGCHGVVFGILDKKNKINIKMCKKLKTFCGNMSTTFHRAFDEIADPFDALESIIDLKFDRILTSGQKKNAKEGIKLITQLAERSKNRISIMPGSGIRSSNIDLFLKNKNINEIHTSSYSDGKFSTNELKKIIKKITQ